MVYNVEGYWDGLLSWVSKSVEQGFVGKANANIMVEAKTSEEVVIRLRDYTNAEGRFNLNWGEK